MIVVGDLLLLVVVRIHENAVASVAVEELHGLTFEFEIFETFVSPEMRLPHNARWQHCAVWS